MKKILFINTQFPLFSAPNCGGANRSQMFLHALAHVGHVDVVSFWDNEKSDIPNCEVIHSGRPHMSSTKQYSGMIKFVRLLAPWNADCVFPLNRELEKFVDGLIASGGYDYIAVRYLYVGAECGLLKYSDKLIIDIDDNPRNMFALRSQQADKWSQRLYYLLASISAAIMTNVVLRKVYCSFYPNPEQCPSRHSILLHNVSIQNQKLQPVSLDTPKRVLVVGSWWYYPNKSGLEHFVSHVWPKVVKIVSDAELRVVGKGMESSLIGTCKNTQGVNVLGFVDDIMQEYQQVRCVIVPIYQGCGTCVKVIETMCVNRPFVSTPYGVRGIENSIKDGNDYLLAKDDAMFAEHIITMLQKPELGAQMASNALKCVQKDFSIEKFNQIVEYAIK